MKKSTKILITLLIIFIAASAVLFVWQRENIMALVSSLNNSSEDLAVKMDEHRNKVKKEVEKYVSNPIEDISAEDEQKLLKGELSVEDIAKKYNLPLDYIKDEEHSPDKTGGTNNNDKPQTAETDTKALDEAISSSVSKMYALKAKYVGKLGELERQVIEEYKNLPKDKQTESAKRDLLRGIVGQISSYEKKCDDEVNLVLSNLEAELKKHNGDKEIINILKEAYVKEKEVKKAYYLSIYNN